MQRFKQVGWTLLLLASGAWAAAPAPEAPSLDSFPRTALSIITPDARQHRFEVWVAANDAQRQQGLMFVKSLPEQTGMLFLFGAPQRIQMWMKNTYIPLDMLFIDSQGHIVNIAANATPLSTRIIDSKEVVSAVLELAGGSAAKLSIHIGGIVQHPVFSAARE